ncbi:hypothetical protein [Parafrankia sp. CH37]|uniref:hypothetical protein n=1 Tax=Parafrankia sp. CH37 TaxID=683308 RepID=UPI001D00E07E|nr:hypothetical protein [Parafrankia sp. CH37]
MLVVHGVCTPSGLPVLWAEDTRRFGRPPQETAADPSAHPFAAMASDLAPLAAARPTASGRLAVLLPSLTSGAPLASPELAATLTTAIAGSAGPRARSTAGTEHDAQAQGPALRTWQVDTICLGLSPACGPWWEPGEGVRLGASAGFLLAVDAFGAELVDRGRVLPAVGWDGARPLARWSPVLTGPDAARFDELVAAMPPAFRAAAPTAAGGVLERRGHDAGCRA